MASIRQASGKRDMPPGQSGGLLSPLLETVRAGHVARWIEGRNILDCGCGRGRLLEMLSRDVHYIGVELDSRLVRYLQKRFLYAQFLCKDITKGLNFLEGGCFECIVLSAILEHLRSPRDLLEDIVRLLCPGGVIVITTPTPLWDLLLHSGSRLGIFDNNADEEHEVLLGRAEIEAMLEDSGLILEKYYRFSFGGNQLALGRKPDEHPKAANFSPTAGRQC